MAHFTSALSFLLVLVLFSLAKIEARESKFFTKAVVIHANVTHHVEPPSPAPSPSISPSPAPVEAEVDRGYGLYGRDEIPNTSGGAGESLFKEKTSTEEFGEKFGKDEFDNSGLPSNYNERSYVTVSHGDNKEKFGNEEFNNNDLPSNYNGGSYVNVPQGDNKEKYGNKEFNNNGLPSNYNERSYVTVPQGDNKERFSNDEFNHNGLPSNYNEHSYVTVPHGTNLYDTKSTPTNYENEFTNTEEMPTPEEEKLFNENNKQKPTQEEEKFFNKNHNYNEEKLTPEEEQLFNNEEKLTPEEEQLFNENSNYNEHNEKSFVNSNEQQKFRDTPRFAQMGNYFNDNHNHNGYHNVGEPQGLSDTRTLENGKYHYALNGSPPKYNSEGYYGNNGEPKSPYEFNTMEEFEKQEGFSQIPGEYINP